MNDQKWYMNISDSDLDTLINEEFPFPIAIAYHQIHSTNSPEEKANLCVDVFEFGIRMVTLALVIRYIKENDADVNFKELNQKIKDYLPQSYPEHWIELLESILKAYEGNRSRFFMPELYDLYHNPPESQTSLWENLKTIADISKQIKYRKINAQNALNQNKLVGKIRDLLRFFGFMSEYEMWLITDKKPEWLSYRLFNGTDNFPSSVPIASIKSPHIDEIQTNKFYLVSRNENHITLFGLDPLLVSGLTINPHDSNNSPGIYEKYIDDDLTDDRPGILEYMLFAVDLKDKIFKSVPNQDLVAQFVWLYEHLLDLKIDQSSTKNNLTWQNLKDSFNQYNQQESMVNALTKYDEDVYIKRNVMHHQLSTFLNANEVAMVITGDAGVGKTNLLIDYYLHNLATNTGYLTLWLDGAALNNNISMSLHIIQLIDRQLTFLEEFPQSESQASHILRNLFERPDFSGKKFIIVIEAINEHQNPIEALQKLNDFINDIAIQDHIKVIITSRPQVWRHTMQNHLKPFRKINYFQGTDDTLIEHNAFAMKPYTPKEQEEAFLSYTKSQKYEIQNANLGNLNSRLREALREPLMLRIVCEAHSKSEIPPNLSVYEILPKLIESLVTDQSKTLKREDIEDFLQQKLVPLFMETNQGPVNRVTRRMLNDYIVDEQHNITLDNLITDHSKILGTAINQQFQNLMGTGWVTKIGKASSYEIRFRYEYFYDYFIGEYLKELFETLNTKEEKQKFLNDWLNKLEAFPFLWGAMHNLLVSIFEKQGELLLEFSLKATELVKDLFISALIEQTNKTFVTEFLSTILNDYKRRKHSSLAPVIFIETAHELKLIDLMVSGLCHKNSEIRAYSVQRVYQRWHQDIIMDNTDTSTAYDAIQKGMQKIQFKQHINAWFAFDGTLSATVLIALHDYQEHGIANSQLSKLQQIWYPFISRFKFLFSSQSGYQSPRFSLRRLLVSVLSIAGVNIVQAVEKAQQLVFSIADLRQYFPASNKHKKILEELVPYIHSSHNMPGSMDKMMELVKQALDTNDLLLAYCAFASLNAAIIGKPTKLAPYLPKLMEQTKSKSFISKNNAKPVAPVLTSMLTMVGQNAPYKKLVEIGKAQEVLASYEHNIKEYENHFGGFCKGKKKTYYWSELAEYSYWYNHINGTPDSPLMQQILDKIIKEEKDGLKIRYMLSRFAHVSRCSLWRSPTVALHGIREIIIRLDDKQQQKYESEIIQTISIVRAVDNDRVKDFLASFSDNELNPEIKTRIKNARANLNMGYVMGDAGIVFAKAMLDDGDDTVRNFLIELLKEANRNRRLSGWMTSLMLELSALIHTSNEALEQTATTQD